MENLPLTDWYDGESRASSYATPSTVEPERNSQEKRQQHEALREYHTQLLAHPLTLEPPARRSVISLNENLSQVSAGAELLQSDEQSSESSGSKEIDQPDPICIQLEIPNIPFRSLSSHSNSPTQASYSPPQNVDSTHNLAQLPDELNAHPTNAPQITISPLSKAGNPSYTPVPVRVSPGSLPSAQSPPSLSPTVSKSIAHRTLAPTLASSAPPSTYSGLSASYPQQIEPTRHRNTTARSPISRSISPTHRKRNRHRRRFARWVKKKFRMQGPWWAGGLHSAMEGERAIRRAESQGLLRREG